MECGVGGGATGVAGGDVGGVGDEGDMGLIGLTSPKGGRSMTHVTDDCMALVVNAIGLAKRIKAGEDFGEVPPMLTDRPGTDESDLASLILFEQVLRP